MSFIEIVGRFTYHVFFLFFLVIIAVVLGRRARRWALGEGGRKDNNNGRQPELHFQSSGCSG